MSGEQRESEQIPTQIPTKGPC